MSRWKRRPGQYVAGHAPKAMTDRSYRLWRESEDNHECRPFFVTADPRPTPQVRNGE